MKHILSMQSFFLETEDQFSFYFYLDVSCIAWAQTSYVDH